jgi:rhamnose transport system substrate-binding protein
MEEASSGVSGHQADQDASAPILELRQVTLPGPAAAQAAGIAVIYQEPTTQVTQGLLEQYPNLKGIISPTTVGIAAAAAVLDTPKYRGKVALTGLGTPDEMKKYGSDGTVTSFELWNPADLGFLL